MIDFSPVSNGDKKYIDLWREQDISIDDLRQWTNESIDTILAMIDDLDDADMVFEPEDPDAHNPHASEAEQNIGWNLAHIICHVTASSEEGAAFSSQLARGVDGVKERPRSEVDWKTVTTKDQCVHRLEESRRMRLAFLDTWPDEPDYDNLRVPKTERFQEYFGDLNAPASFLMGLAHEVGHYDQMKDAKQQALTARQEA